MIYSWAIVLLCIAAVSLLVWHAANRWAAAFVFVFSAAAYWYVGAPQVAMLNADRLRAAAAAAPQTEALEAEVEAHPDNVKAWAKLGMLCMQTGRYTESAEAWRHAVILTQGNPVAILQYNKALIFIADGQVTDEAKKGLQIVLKLEPDNAEARYFLALRALQDGDTQTAMHEMKSLYHTLPEDSPLKEIIDRQIGRKP